MKHLDIWVFSILFLVINHSSFTHCDDSNHMFRQRKITNDDLNYPEMVSRYLKTGKLEVPHRKVRKDWYVGLHPDAVDRSHLDVRDDLHTEEATKINDMNPTNENISESNLSGSTSLANHSSKSENEKTMNENIGSLGSNEIHTKSNSGRLFLQDNASKNSQEGPSSKSFDNSDQEAGSDYCSYYGYFAYYCDYNFYYYYR